MSVADPYTQQEQADFDLANFDLGQYRSSKIITLFTYCCLVITNVGENLLSHSHPTIHHYFRLGT